MPVTARETGIIPVLHVRPLHVFDMDPGSSAFREDGTLSSATDGHHQDFR